MTSTVNAAVGAFGCFVLALIFSLPAEQLEAPEVIWSEIQTSDPCAVCTYSDDGPAETGDLVGGASACDPFMKVTAFPIQNGDCLLDNQNDCTLANKLCKTTLHVLCRLPTGWTLWRTIVNLTGGSTSGPTLLAGPHNECKVFEVQDLIFLDCGDIFAVSYEMRPPEGFSEWVDITLTCLPCPDTKEKSA